MNWIFPELKMIDSMTMNGIVRGLDATVSVLDGRHGNKGTLKSDRLVENNMLRVGKTQQKLVRQLLNELRCIKGVQISERTDIYCI